MATRSGFTLLEVVVALVVTGAVVLLAYGAMAAGIDAAERHRQVDADARAALAARTLLHDALRHAEPALAGDDTVFVLEAAQDAAGRAADRVQFMSRGVVPPFGAGGRWAVSAALLPEGRGLEVLAVPVDVSGGTAVRAVAPGIAAMRIAVLARVGREQRWERAWPTVQAVPAGVRVDYADASGRPAAPALVARTQP